MHHRGIFGLQATKEILSAGLRIQIAFSMKADAYSETHQSISASAHHKLKPVCWGLASRGEDAALKRLEKMSCDAMQCDLWHIDRAGSNEAETKEAE